ncbi:MAG: rhodanese-like domain-containing protein [Bryobacteraceae bacterium]|nr:rhodanese-like domain-containing protein [Bryobacteraceae bacterium]
MYFEQFYLGCLAHASYVLGSDGEAAVVDPQRDVELYLEAARNAGLSIRYVIETHLHADFVSGHQELAARTGAAVYIGAKADARFPHVPVCDGDELRLGRTLLRFLETPGHTPESISVLVVDPERGAEPFAVLTGDTLFIGDVGRPDLSTTFTPQELAGQLYESLHQKLLGLPDGVEVYPAHGAGSLCGRQIGTDRSSTIGRERSTNPALRPMSREAFIRYLTDDLPDRPDYFAREVEINRSGAAPLAELPPLRGIDWREAEELVAGGATILDTRPAAAYAGGHIRGALQIGLGGQFASWAGILLGVDARLILVGEDWEQARVRLARVGIENVLGYLTEGPASATTPHVGPLELRALMAEGEVQVVDVRRRQEWEEGHIEGAQLIPLPGLAKSLHNLDPDVLTAVHCKSGYRSTIAISILERAGFTRLLNLSGGFDAWAAAGLASGSGR